MYESLDALTKNSQSTPLTSPTSPTFPPTPTAPIIPIHYKPNTLPISPSSYNSSYIPHEIEIVNSYDYQSRRHFKIIGDTFSSILPDDDSTNCRRYRHTSQISSISTASSSDFSTLTVNTSSSTTSSSSTLNNNLFDTDADDLAFEKLIQFDPNNNNANIPLSPNNTNFDVIISVGEGPSVKRFRSHSIILCKRSYYFRTAFSNHWVKKQGDMYFFDKPNLSSKVFTTILRYLYFGNVKLERLDILTILDLLKASDELVLQDFTHDIQSYFIHLNSDWLKTKIVPILQCSYSNPIAFSKLLLHTLTIIKKDPTCLLIQNDLHLLTEQIMDKILNECYNGLDDWAIWQCILQWAIGQEKIYEFSHDIKKWHQYEFNTFHELIFNLVEKYVRFSHISRNYFLDKILPYLNYLTRDFGSDVGEEIVRYYLSNNQRNNYHHTTHHKSTQHKKAYTNFHTSTNIILEDSALMNHLQALKITDWIQESNYVVPNVVNTTNFPSKLKKSSMATPAAYQFNLLFRMTRDGASTHHDRCINQGPALVVAKIKLPSSGSTLGGYILVGGYNPDCTKSTKDCSKNFKVSPITLSMKKPKKELFYSRVNNNKSSESVNNYNRFDNGTNELYFSDDLIINFQEKFVKFNGGHNFGLIESDIVECEIFQVKELCY
ncbi:1121_t:CDS:2 [Funneliformis caledonium]|uniref:1121_t:CDS:1 n=1 Tax=Funneliformis caledonium TaxID=1117310 RepID=A0A9N8Z4E8_9GLOM|nr:1121_t:CDS:2 [Funneliformis caledonium]